MKRNPTHIIKLICILAGLAILPLRVLLGLNPYVTESLYSNGIFQVIRICLDYTVGLLPVPLIYILVLMLLFVFVKKITRFFKKRKERRQHVPGYDNEGISFKTKILRGLFTLSAYAGAIVFLFYFSWGFNYLRLPIEEHLLIKPVPLDIEGIRNETNRAVQMVVKARKEIPGSGEKALDASVLPLNLEASIRQSLETVLKEMGYPCNGRVRGRKLFPGALMMSFAVGGIYFPFTGEGYIPANLTPMEIPFSMAHEMVHGYGFAEEGTANFLAYLACTSSDDPLVRYSGCLEYFDYISGDLFRASRQEYEELRKSLPKGIIADKIKIYRNWKQYRSWLMDLGQKVNDIYLKSQGVNEGIKSYNRLIVLTTAYREKVGSR